MKRALLLGLLFFINVQAGSCAGAFTTIQPLQPLQPIAPMAGVGSMRNYTSNVTELPDQFSGNNISPDVNYLRLNQIEKSLYGRTYNNQDIVLRLSRIEQSLFRRTFSSTPLVQRMDNIISNFNQVNQYPNISQNALSRMETKIFNRTYSQADTESRIEKLEQKLFGAVQSGDVPTRYEALKTAVGNYAPQSAYYPSNVQNRGWKGLAANLGSAFLGGSMTGYTPPIGTYGNDSYGYGNDFGGLSGMSGLGGLGNNGLYRGYRSNHGYSDSFTNYGSGTGVTILD